MKRRVNVKLLILLPAGLFLAGVGVYFLHGAQLHRSAGSLLRRADQAAEHGDPARAASYLEQYLTIRPDDGAAMIRYGLLLDRQATSLADRSKAFVALRQGFRLQPERSDAGRRLAQLAMALGRHADARQALRTLLGASPENAELEEWCGLCELADKHYSEAIDYFTRAIRHGPERIDSYVQLAGIQHSLRKTEQANEILDHMVAANVRSFQAYLARGKYRRETGSLAASAEDMSRALALAPQNADVLRANGDIAMAQDRLDEARRLLRQAIEASPHDARGYVALALVEQQAGKEKEAESVLRRGLKGVPETDQDGILFVLVDLLIQRNELRETKSYLAGLRRGRTDPALLDYQAARVLIQEDRWSDALPALERLAPVLTSRPEVAIQVHLLRGLCYEKLGAADLQLSAYGDAITLASLARGVSWSARTHVQLGSALLALDRVDEAVERFERMMLNSHDVPARGRILLAQALLAQTARLPPEQRDWHALQQALAEAARAEPASIQVVILQAEALALKGQPERGRQVLGKARDEHPEQVGFWVASARWDERFGAGKAVTEILDQAERRLGFRAQLQMTRLDYYLRHQPAQARPLLRKLEGQLGLCSAAEQMDLLDALAQAYVQLGERSQAQRLWDELAARQPANLVVRLKLFNLAVQAGDGEAMQRLLQGIKDIEGEQGTLWRYGEAARLVARADARELGQARALLAEVRARRPNWSQIPGLEAEICERQGNLDDALENYRRAVTLGDTRPALLKRLVELCYERGQFTEGAGMVRRAGAQTPLAVQQLAVELSLQKQDMPRALAMARAAVDKAPQDYQNHLLLGLSLWGAGQHRDAEASLRQAIRLAESRPETWVTLVCFLVDTKQRERAVAVTGEAQIKLPAGQASLALALCCEKIDQGERAAHYYRAALAEKPDNAAVIRQVASFFLRRGDAPKAEPLLRSLMRRDSDVPDGDRFWAKRTLALTMGMRGSYQQFKEALSYLEGRESTSPADVADTRVKARLLATRAFHHPEAIRLYEQISARQPLTAEEEFILVQLYEAKRDWASARRLTLHLLAADPESLTYLYHAARNALRENDIAQTQRWLAQLEKLHARAYPATEMKARLLQYQGRGEQAANVLEDFARLEKPERLASVAALLEELGHSAAAEKTFRDHAARTKRPESVLSLAGFLVRQRRLAEALDLYERAWSSLPPVVVAGASVAALGYVSPCDLAQCQRVDRWLKKAIAQDPREAMLPALRADLEALRGRRVEAAALYRKSLALDSRNFWALGNLAWLLAHEEGKEPEALDLASRAEEAVGPLPELLDVRALVHLRTGGWELAIKALKQALQEKPTPTLYFHLAQAFVQASDPRAARDALRETIAGAGARGAIHPLEAVAYRSLVVQLNEP
ncbi:MAG TPA: tetratricopeptide repeat protein [Gemmataceae bacterium]|jgi:tetratricopeptide (TPR) repeat protein|nr:tetratricopeptide repeat protein [Gemmataceae bacterium]